MKILMVCAEYAPLAKTGGLADAVAGLAGALAARGHDVRVLLPMYSDAMGEDAELVPAPAGALRFRALPAQSRAPRVYLLKQPQLASGPIYAADDRDGLRFAQLAEAALALPGALGFTPDLVHCHDWHAALVPVLARERGMPWPCVLTLHNIGYQGVFGEHVLAGAGLAELGAAIDPSARSDGHVNFLRAGLAAAQAITTVSPTYAREILTPEFGMGLEDLLVRRADHLTGILNGVDYQTWSPERDPYLTEHYGPDDLAPKYKLKGALCVRLGLPPDQNAPLIGLVSRLVPQKGIDLFVAALPQLIETTRASFAVLGAGDPSYMTALRALAADHPRRVAFTSGHDEALAHEILAGSDAVLVPSRYEPCGLTQMYGLKFGTVPVVRATGGLADTIQHFDRDTGLGNGSVFRDADVGGLLWGIREALSWYDRPPLWSRVIANGMRADFSWQRQTRAYENVYRRLA